MSSPLRRLAATAVALGGLVAHVAAADGVRVVAGQVEGRGLARARDQACFVITPHHVVEHAAEGGGEIRILGAGGEPGRAVFERAVGAAEDDVALLRVVEGGAVLCSGEDGERFREKPGTHLVLRKENGAFDFVPVAILHEGPRDVQIAAMGQGARIVPGMSGSILVADGSVKGLLIETPTGESPLAEVRSIEYLVGELGPWIRDPAPLPDLDQALSVLSRAVEARPTGDVGQVAAAELLVRRGSGLAGMDLGGLSFEGAVLDRGELPEAILDGGKLDRASLQGANLARAHLGFSTLREARLTGAVIEGTRFYFAVADGAVLRDARAAGSNWTGASARGADFRGADLTGASFHYADLTDADFRGAKLTETLLIGAILTGARFEGAEVASLDVTAAIGEVEAFDDAQRKELCGTQVGGWRGQVELGRVVPDTTSSVGQRFDRIGYELFPVVQGLRLLDPCPLRGHRPAGIETVERIGDQEVVKTRFMLYFPATLLDRANRGAKFYARFEDQLHRLEQALADRRIVVAPGPVHRGITAELEKQLSQVEPVTDEIWLEPEVLFLLALREHPERFEEYRWQSRAEQRLFDEQPGDGSEPDPPGPWPPFFPPDLLAQQVGPGHVDVYRRWTEARAAALPSVFAVSLERPRGVTERLRRRVKNREGGPPPDPFVVTLAEMAGGGLPEGLLDGIEGAEGGFRLDRDGLFRYVLAFPHPLDAYRLEIPLAVAETLTLGERRGELRIRVEGVEVVERDSETYAILRCQLVALRLASETAAYPPELATRGTFPVTPVPAAPGS